MSCSSLFWRWARLPLLGPLLLKSGWWHQLARSPPWGQLLLVSLGYPPLLPSWGTDAHSRSWWPVRVGPFGRPPPWSGGGKIGFPSSGDSGDEVTPVRSTFSGVPMGDVVWTRLFVSSPLRLGVWAIFVSPFPVPLLDVTTPAFITAFAFFPLFSPPVPSLPPPLHK